MESNYEFTISLGPAKLIPLTGKEMNELSLRSVA
jgi:hypothetical protein